jgi:hypothetical protein
MDYLIHNIDECCWMKDAWPVRAQGSGGRLYRGKNIGQNFDHYSIGYTSADGARLFVWRGAEVSLVTAMGRNRSGDGSRHRATRPCFVLPPGRYLSRTSAGRCRPLRLLRGPTQNLPYEREQLRITMRLA